MKLTQVESLFWGLFNGRIPVLLLEIDNMSMNRDIQSELLRYLMQGFFVSLNACISGYDHLSEAPLYM
jgi:hypothetical protein